MVAEFGGGVDKANMENIGKVARETTPDEDDDKEEKDDEGESEEGGGI